VLREPERDYLVVAGQDGDGWELTPQEDEPGYARKCLTGHNQAVQDVVTSSDGQFCLSASWDKTMRLWDLNVGQSVRAFVGHTSDVNSVAFSSDNRQIVSGSRDKTIRLWNTLADCKYVITDDAHSDWVSQVRFSPSAKQPLIVSCGWDKLVKVWNLNNCKLRYNLAGHSAPLSPRPFLRMGRSAPPAERTALRCSGT